METIRGVSEETVEALLTEEIKETVGTNNPNLRLFWDALINNKDRVEITGYPLMGAPDQPALFRVKKISVYDKNNQLIYFKDTSIDLPKQTFSVLAHPDGQPIN